MIQQGFIHPKLTLREAKALLAEFSGKQTAAEQRKANVRERLRRFAEFVRHAVNNWEPDEWESPTERLTRLIEEIGTAGGMALTRNGNSLNFITKCNLLTDQQNIHL